MRKLRWVLTAVLTASVLALPSCDWPWAPAAEEPEADPEGGFPVTITDYAGRKVTLPEMPRRIVSLAPSNTEILAAIGALDRIIGIDDVSDYPAEVGGLPRLGGVYGFNFETLLALEPDLVLVIEGMIEHRQRMEELGLPVVVIQPADFAGILDSIILIGELTGNLAQAEALAEELSAQAEEITSAVAGVAEVDRPLVLVEIWDDPLMSVGPGGFVHELVEMAGGRNLAADADMEWCMIDEEVVIDRNPDVILMFFAESHRALVSGSRPGWEGITAVAEGRVHVVSPDLLTRPGPRVVQGLRLLARLFHPDLID